MALLDAAKDQAWRDWVAQAHKDIAVESRRQNNIFDLNSKSLKMIAESKSRASEMAIMMKDLLGLDDEQIEYFKLK